MQRAVLPLLVLFLALALASPPAAAADDRIVSSGDTIYVGEENLNLTPLFAGSPATGGRLVHMGVGGADNTIDVPDRSSFDVSPVEVGGVTGIYTVWPGQQWVNVSGPFRLDVVLNGSPNESVTGEQVAGNRTVDLVLTGGPAAAANAVRVTLAGPGGVNMTGNETTIGTIDLSGLPPGFYAARATVFVAGEEYTSNSVAFGVVR
jgi:hypothetical protein